MRCLLFYIIELETSINSIFNIGKDNKGAEYLMIELTDKPLAGMTFIDLFAGIGGFHLAFESLGASCIYSNEWDKQAQAVYSKNFNMMPEGDITKVNENDIPDHDILCAGFPCFAAGTLVMTENGFMPIEQIQPGDYVLTHHDRYKKVLRVGKTPHASTIVLHGPNDTHIECTPGHPFLSLKEPSSRDAIIDYDMDSFYYADSECCWRKAQRMLGKQWYNLCTHQWNRCNSMTSGHDDITVYNMEVEEDHSYNAFGIAVHNCQAFSISGNQRGFEDSRGTLFFDVARIVRAKQPKVVMMENVKNFAHHDHGNTLSVVQNTMHELGYTFDYKVLNAAEYGVPQSRERIYMVCFRNDLGIERFVYPEKIELTRHVKDILLDDESLVESLYVSRPDMHVRADDGHYDNKPIRLGYVNKGGQGERIYSINGTAITLSAYGGGIFAKTGGYLVGGRVRKLHPRECARLMGFPDDYQMADSNAQAYKQFGNSVVVDVLQQIGLNIGHELHEQE